MSANKPLFVCSRHDKSGVWLINAIDISGVVGDMLRAEGIPFTQITPTEIVAQSSYEIASACQLLARHCRVVKIQ